MVGAGASAYTKVGLETDVVTADPHRLVLILFDGALQCILRAKSFLASNNIPQKCRYVGKAIQIVDQGLKAAVDPSADPEFAGRLVSLYNYIEMRLLQANLRNDAGALDEAARHLTELRSAWVKIGPAAGAMARPVAAEPAAAVYAETAAPARGMLRAYQA